MLGGPCCYYSLSWSKERDGRAERKKRTKAARDEFFPIQWQPRTGFTHTHAASDKEKKGRNSSRRFSLFFFLFVFHEENDEKAARRTHIFGSVITPSATTLSSGQNKTWNSTSLRPHKLRMWSIALGPNAKRIDDVKKSWPSPRRSVFTIQWH